MLIGSGGLSAVEFVSGGGTTSGTIVSSGGVEIVMAGGTAVATVISGGTLEIQSGGSVGAGGVQFGGSGGTLTIDGTTMPTSTISGFVTGDTIDLAGVSFASGGSIQLGAGNLLNAGRGRRHLQPTARLGAKLRGQVLPTVVRRPRRHRHPGREWAVDQRHLRCERRRSAPVGFRTDVDYVVSTV